MNAPVASSAISLSLVLFRNYVLLASLKCIQSKRLFRLRTPGNRRLLAIIRDRKPPSIAELAEWSGRAAPNVARTLVRPEAIGSIRMEEDQRRKVPAAVIHKPTMKSIRSHRTTE